MVVFCLPLAINAVNDGGDLINFCWFEKVFENEVTLNLKLVARIHGVYSNDVLAESVYDLSLATLMQSRLRIDKYIKNQFALLRLSEYAFWSN